MTLLRRVVNRIGVKTLWRDEEGRLFVRLENRTVRTDYEVTRERAERLVANWLKYGADTTPERDV